MQKLPQRRGSSPEPPFASGGEPPDPHVITIITPAYYLLHVEFISIAKCVLLL